MAKETKVYVYKTSTGRSVPARYKVTRVIGTLDVEPGQYLTKEEVETLMKSHVVIVDPMR